MQLAFTADKNTFHLISPQLKNIIAFNRQKLTIIVVHNIEPEANAALFSQLEQEFASYHQVEFKFHYLPASLQQEWGMPAKYTNHGIYLRLYLPRLGYHGRVLYLDLDLLCLGDLEALYNYDLQGKSLGAVTDINNHLQRFNSKTFFDERFSLALQQAGFGESKDYFNSGVLLIDLDALEARGNPWVTRLNEIFSKGVFLHDQDFLNEIHLEDRVKLPVKYNYLTFCLIPQRHFLMYKEWDFTKISAPSEKQKFFAQTELPVLVHFIGREKIHLHSHQEFKDIYAYFAEQTVEQIVQRPVDFYQGMALDFFTTFGYLAACYDFDLEAIDAFGKVTPAMIGKLQRGKPYNASPAVLNPYLIKSKTLSSFLTRIFASKKKRLAYAQKVYAKHANFFAKYH
ncbi:glycosyltransferase [Psittacicella hinzii]|nr:glycosyltransferase [Psittacicella hinzii]